MKTFVLLGILAVTAAWAWNQFASGEIAFGVVAIAGIGGFITAMITIFKPTAAPVTAPIYAAFEGVFLGAISQVIQIRYQDKFPGRGRHRDAGRQPDRRCALCDDVRLCHAAHPRHRQTAHGDRCGDRCGGAFLRDFDGAAFVWRWRSDGFRGDSLGIGFSLFVVGLAAFNLLLDFDFIEKSAQHDAPKYMEWYGAFGLMVTLIWLYLEILRLLSKLADRREADRWRSAVLLSRKESSSPRSPLAMPRLWAILS